ncbi:MAG: 3-methyl-2-oxobutanoate hydroxymethyltransferase [Fibrobacterales bacterium]
MLKPIDFIHQKKSGQKISVLTAYDVNFARLLEEVQIDAILVGDSAANVVWGHGSTRDIGMEEMILSTAAVARGARNTHIISDMPYQSDSSVELALENGQKLVAAGAHSVKIEGTKFDQIKALTEKGIDVVGHLGLTPQTATSLKQVGKSDSEAEQMIDDALQLQQLGAIAIVLEHIPDALGGLISDKISIPTIGCGAGKLCDGQVMVLHDMLGIPGGKYPPFSKQFADLNALVKQAFSDYKAWVEE